MAWIKRNLLFVIGGVVALALLGAAAFYNFSSWSRNSARLDKLNEIYGDIKNVNDPTSSPGNNKIDKTAEAREQQAQLQDWLAKAVVYFESNEPIPLFSKDNPVTSENFAAALRRTIDLLQHEADTAHVQVPPAYGFSFEAERSLVTFAPGSLELLAGQLGDVKTISEIMYGAGINDFDGIQRIHASVDDANGAQSDYINELPVTTDTATMTPYAVTFRSFGPEIARVFAGFANSKHGFLIKSLNVQPAGANQPSETAMMPSRFAPPGMASGMTPGMPMPDKSGLVTVLNEQLLRVSMEIEIVKLQTKN